MTRIRLSINVQNHHNRRSDGLHHRPWGCLIVIQILTLHAAAGEAASAYMDAASANALSRLEAELASLSSLLRVLSTNPFLADSDDRSVVDGAVGLFKRSNNCRKPTAST
jgi:hypothetical protein